MKYKPITKCSQGITPQAYSIRHCPCYSDCSYYSWILSIEYQHNNCLVLYFTWDDTLCSYHQLFL